jgi:iron(III) transport system permease protein
VTIGPVIRALALPLLLALGVLALAPTVMVAVTALIPDNGEGLRSVLAAPEFRAALGNTLAIAAEVSFFSLACGLGLAALAEYAPPRGLSWLDPLILAPFLLPPYLTAVAWTLLAGPSGLLEQVIPGAAMSLAPILYSRFGIALVMAMHLAPLVYVMLRGAMAGLDSRLIRAARVHGAGPLRAVWTGLLPGLLPALAAGALIAFLAASEEFGVPAILGSYAGVSVLSTTVEEAVTVWPVALSKAAGVGLVMCAIALLAWSAVRPLERAMPVAREGRERPARRGWSLWPVLAFILLATILPLAAILAASVEKAVTSGLHANNLTASHYQTLFAWRSLGWQAMRTSLALSVAVAACGMALALASGWLRQRLGRGGTLLDALAMLPMAMPGVVLSVGMILFWNAAWNPLPVYGRLPILGLAYLTVTLPYAFRYAQAGLRQVPQALLDAAAVHGGKEFRVIRQVALPLVWPLLVAGGTVVFALSMRELVASVMLQPPGVQVISTYVFNQFEQGNVGDGMAMSVAGVLTSAVLLGLARRIALPR